MTTEDDYKTTQFTAQGRTYTLRMSPKKHVYSYQEEGDEGWTRLPSVTTVGKSASGFDASTALRWQRRLIGDALYANLNKTLDPGMVGACLNAADKSRDGAADRGTFIHEQAEALFRSIRDNHAFDLAPLDELHAILAWAQAWNVRPILVEQMVAHIDEGYAGTLDLLAYYTDPEDGDERIGLFDLKTGKGVYPQNFNQLSAYWNALEWQDAEALPEARFILHLPEGADDVHVVKPTEEHARDLTAFRTSQFLYGYNADGARAKKRGWPYR